MAKSAKPDPAPDPSDLPGDLLGGFGDAGSATHALGVNNRNEGPQGHRERLRNRFIDGGSDAIPDYELLELILFRAIARRDTKGLAKGLIARFGSFAPVLNAPKKLLREVKGVGDAAAFELKLVRAASVRLMRAEIIDKPVLSSWQQVVDYCHAVMAYEAREQFRILFLDKKNKRGMQGCPAGCFG